MSDRFGSAVHFEFRENVFDVNFNGADSNNEPVGNFLVGQSRCEQGQHLKLSLREVLLHAVRSRQ
ncbi:hypothetical protein D3C76_1612350 [compost metagenome]